jgi:redox-sensing transcriptional repressor
VKEMDDKMIPDIVVARLPRYLRTLQYMAQEGIKTTSSKELGEKMGYSAAQIRKDLSQFGEFGKQGTGYNIPFLTRQLQSILHIEESWNVALVGAGDLGHAIARSQAFANRGFEIRLVFDNDPAIIGKQIGNFIVQDSAEIVSMIQKSGIRIAILTVPTAAAQSVAEELVKAEIKAILSYAPVLLDLPSDILVEYIDPIIQLQHMTYYLH